MEQVRVRGPDQGSAPALASVAEMAALRLPAQLCRLTAMTRSTCTSYYQFQMRRLHQQQTCTPMLYRCPPVFHYATLGQSLPCCQSSTPRLNCQQLFAPSSRPVMEFWLSVLVLALSVM